MQLFLSSVYYRDSMEDLLLEVENGGVVGARLGGEWVEAPPKSTRQSEFQSSLAYIRLLRHPDTASRTFFAIEFILLIKS